MSIQRRSRWLLFSAIGIVAVVLARVRLSQDAPRKHDMNLEEESTVTRPLAVLADPRAPQTFAGLADPGAPAGAVLRVAQQRARMIAYRRRQAAGASSEITWTELGPGNIGGRIRSIVIDPDTPSRIWAGAVTGGIWITEDNGENWHPTDDSLANLGISCLARSAAGVLYAGTGELGFSGGSGTRGLGVFKSGDDGGSWDLLPRTTKWENVNRIAVDPFDDLHLLVATTSGLFVSFDGGASWKGRCEGTLTSCERDADCAGDVTCQSAPAVTGNIQDVDFHPMLAGEAIASNSQGSVLWSDDGGRAWTASTMSGSPASTTIAGYYTDSGGPGGSTRLLIDVASTAGFAARDRLSISSHPFTITVYNVIDGDTLQIDTALSDSDVGETIESLPNGRIELAYFGRDPFPYLAYASMDASEGVLWRSLDYGRTFSILSNPDHLLNQGDYDNTIWVDPNDPCNIVMGGRILYRSMDCGSAFANASGELHLDQHYLVPHPNFDGISNKTMFVANDGGIYRAADIYRDLGVEEPCAESEDCPSGELCSRGKCYIVGFGWEALNHSLGITQFYYAAVNPFGDVIGGTQDNGVLRYHGDLNSWTHMPEGGGDGWLCVADPLDPMYFYYVGNASKEVVRSSDGGMTAAPMAGSPAVSRVLLLDPNNPERLYAADTHSLYVDDHPKAALTGTFHWIRIKDAITPGETRAGEEITAMVVAEGDPTIIWVCHANGDVYRTTTFSEVGCGTDTCAGCACWAKVDSDASGTSILPDRDCSGLAIDRHDPNRVYVTFGRNSFSPDNVWKTDNGLDAHPTWTRIDGGTNCVDPSVAPPTALPCEPARVITIHPDQPGWLFLGTPFGLYTSRDDGRTWSTTSLPPNNVCTNDLDWMNETTLIAATHGRGIWRGDHIVADCNATGVPDHLELADNDCDGNFVPDECEPDCNGNGNPDACDLAAPVTFVRTVVDSIADNPASLALTDLNGDGFDDLIAASRGSDSSVSVFSVRLNAGNADTGAWLGFHDADVYPLGVEPTRTAWVLTSGDFDKDGDADVAVYVTGSRCCPGETFSELQVYENDGLGNLSGYQTVSDPGTHFEAAALIAHDLNGDGWLDLAIANTRTGPGSFGTDLSLLFNAGERKGAWDGFVPPYLPEHFPSVGREPRSLAVAYLNEDAFPDLVVANAADGNVSLLVNDGSGSFSEATTLTVGGTPSSVVAADWNADGFDDLAVANGTTDVMVFLTTGATTFAVPVPVAGDAGLLETLGLGDMNHDGILDLITQGTVLLADGAGGFSAPYSLDAGALSTASAIAAGDLDRDGFPDDLALTPATGGSPPPRAVHAVLNDATSDCNGNGVPDECDLALDGADTNDNGVLDCCELACDSNGDCECNLADWAPIAACVSGPGGVCAGTISSTGGFRTDLDYDRDTDLFDVYLFMIQFTGNRGCCVAHGPGCADLVVASCVCDIMPECCTSAWTAECVRAVSSQGCGVCPYDASCGNGICDASETCSSCDRDCGPCFGDCCAAHDTLGCERIGVQDCVCGLLPRCCREPWDESCATLASASCHFCCGNGRCESGESCARCPEDCGTCTAECGNDNCEVGETCGTCPQDCRACPGSCCSVRDTIGCDDITIQACVCGLDPTCCIQAWSASCVSLARQCGVCDGDCCNEHASPGCADDAVQSCVCTIDTRCCESTWSSTCVELATGQCAGCRGDCCVAHATGGCNDPAIETCVCTQVPFCCDFEWNENCIGLVSGLQCGVCP